jgi:hypothetical protein
MLMTIFLLIVLALVAVAAIPLAMGIVPPNPYFGWPTRRSASKPDLWVQVNRFAGGAVLVAVAVAAVALMIYNGTVLRSAFAQLAFVIVALAIPVGATFWYNRRGGG